MAAGGVPDHQRRIQNALVTEWPKPFDIKSDIFQPGKASTFRRQLNAALATRGLLQAIEEQPITYQDVANANPNAAGADIIAAVCVNTPNSL